MARTRSAPSRQERRRTEASRPASAPSTEASRRAARPGKAADRHPVERAANGRLVARTMALLVDHEREAGKAERVLGEHLLDEYFAGDVRLARSRSPVKALSYRALADRAELETSWDEAELHRATLMAIVYRSLDVGVRKALGRDQLYRLASIEAVGDRRRLAARIASGELKGHEVRDAIAEVGAGERSGGRPTLPKAIRVTRGLLRAAERACDDDALRGRALRSLDSASKSEVAKGLRATIAQLRELLRAIEKE